MNPGPITLKHTMPHKYDKIKTIIFSGSADTLSSVGDSNTEVFISNTIQTVCLDPNELPRGVASRAF